MSAEAVRPRVERGELGLSSLRRHRKEGGRGEVEVRGGLGLGVGRHGRSKGVMDVGWIGEVGEVVRWRMGWSLVGDRG